MAAMTRRRLCLNLALALVLCLCLFPFHASADSSNLVVNGMEYVATANHEGSGWSYTYASGMGYLRLNGYNGGPIVLPLSASVEYDGTNMITAKEGENALYCTGEVLSLGSSDPGAALTLMGGSGAPAIFGGSVSLWGWGQLYAFGGSGASAIRGDTAVLARMEQMVLLGGDQMAITTDLNGIVQVIGAHKYFAGSSESTAVETDFYGGEFYLRAEAARATVTFDGNGGTVNDMERYSLVLVVTTSGTDLALYTPQREKYTFLGWNTEADGSGSEPPSRLFSGGEITYYAQWERTLSLPETMLMQENGQIYVAIYYAGGRLWKVIPADGELSALTLPKLPEEGMTYTIYCVDRSNYRPLTASVQGTL